MKFARCFTMIVVLMGVPAFLPAVAASFDCKKAASEVEKLICENPELSKLDDDLAQAYKNALISAADKEALKKNQVWWLKFTRNICQAATCLDEAYKARIIELTIPAVFGGEEEKRRESMFIAKAKAKEMNCSHEAQALVDKIPGEFDRDTTKNIFIYECLRGMIKTQRFDEAKRQIETLGGNPQIWGMRVLGTVGNIPSYVMTGRIKPKSYSDSFCGSKQKYNGHDLEKLTKAVLKRINLNDGDPSNHSQSLHGLDGLAVYIGSLSTPGCLDKSQIIRMYNLLLDSGLKTTFWIAVGMWSDAGDHASASAIGVGDFSDVMWLGNEQLVRRILKSGISVINGDTPHSLFVHAPNMQMVRLLEEYGFRLTSDAARQVLTIINDELYPENADLPDEDVMKYYQTLAK